MPKQFKQEGGAIPLMTLIAVVGLVAFLAASNTFNFKDTIFKTLFPKPPSNAAEQIKDDLKKHSLDLLNLNKQYHNASKDQKQTALDKVKSQAKDRKTKMIALMQQDPAAFLNIAYPTKVKQQFPQEVQTDLEEQVTLEGTYYKDHLDNFIQKKSTTIYTLQTSDNKLYQLYLTKDPDKITPSSHVRIRGTKLGNAIAAYTESKNNFSEINPSSGNSNKVLGTSTTTVYKTAVFILSDQSMGPSVRDPWSLDVVKAAIFTSLTSTKNYLKKVSDNKIDIVGIDDPQGGDVYDKVPWDSSSAPPGCNGFTVEYYEQSGAAAAVARLNSLTNNQGAEKFAQYDRVIYMIPSQACIPMGYGGFYLLDHPSSVVVFGYNSSWTSHELMHSFYSGHAGLYTCKDSQGNIVPISSNCDYDEYHDPFDVMGGEQSYRQINGIHKIQAGWVDSVNFKTVDYNVNTTYSILPLEQPSSGIQILEVPATDYLSNRFGSYYLEYRQPTDPFDNFATTDSVTSGILVHFVNGSAYTPFPISEFIHSRLINTNPIPGNTDPLSTLSGTAALQLNQTFTDVRAGVKFTLTGLTKSTTSPGGITTSGKADVAVSFFTSQATCDRAKPTVTILPPDTGVYGTAGDVINYTIIVTNNDWGCSAATFNITSTLFGAGWVQTPAQSSITVKPGETGSIPITIQSDVKSGPGDYFINETVTNTADANYTVNANPSIYIVYDPVTTTYSSVTYQKYTKDLTLPTISISSPVSGTTVPKGSIFYITSQESDNIGLFKVEFYVNGAFACPVITYSNPPVSASENCAWSIPNKPGVSYLLQAKAYDTSNNSLGSR